MRKGTTTHILRNRATGEQYVLNGKWDISPISAFGMPSVTGQGKKRRFKTTAAQRKKARDYYHATREAAAKKAK